MRYDLLPKGNYYKANLHCHTTCSDGKWTPEEVKEKYMEKGYSIIAYTDHERIIPHNELSDESFLAITSYEYAINDRDSERCYHLNLFSKDKNCETIVGYTPEYVDWRFANEEARKKFKYYGEPVERVYSQEFVNGIVAEAKRHGFFVSLNHPVWSLQTFADYDRLEGLWALEMFNYGCYVDGFLEDANHVLDKMLRKGMRLSVTSTDDNHNGGRTARDSFGGFNMVRADSLDYDTVINALERGDTYSSNGPLFEEIFIEDGFVHIKCSPVREIRMLTEGRDGMIARSKNGVIASTSSKSDALSFKADCEKSETLTEAVFELDKSFCGRFIRFDLRDEKGGFADTRAYFWDEFEKLLPEDIR